MVGKFASPVTGRLVKSHGVMKPKNTRKIIRNHHRLMKKKAGLESRLKTSSAGEMGALKEEIEKVDGEIRDNGGLDKYQQASIAGQSGGRGGDSSKILVGWLDDMSGGDMSDLSMLEVGCLSVKNACSQSKYFKFIERIDLNSQDVQIKQQDFLNRPLPKTVDDKFDVVSLSLVLNYVPQIETRGEMIYRTTQFLNSRGTNDALPALFLVLPSPCVNNSRYLTEERLLEILSSLGYKLTKRKEAKKVIYWLLTLERALTQGEYSKLKGKFTKKLVNDRKNRNNFTVII